MYGRIENILCHNCEKPCGRLFPATRIDPSYAEGDGENHTDEEGHWYCSDACRDEFVEEHKPEEEEEVEDDGDTDEE